MVQSTPAWGATTRLGDQSLGPKRCTTQYRFASIEKHGGTLASTGGAVQLILPPTNLEVSTPRRFPGCIGSMEVGSTEIQKAGVKMTVLHG